MFSRRIKRKFLKYNFHLAKLKNITPQRATITTASEMMAKSISSCFHKCSRESLTNDCCHHCMRPQGRLKHKKLKLKETTLKKKKELMMKMRSFKLMWPCY